MRHRVRHETHEGLLLAEVQDAVSGADLPERGDGPVSRWCLWCAAVGWVEMRACSFGTTGKEKPTG